MLGTSPTLGRGSLEGRPCYRYQPTWAAGCYASIVVTWQSAGLWEEMGTGGGQLLSSQSHVEFQRRMGVGEEADSGREEIGQKSHAERGVLQVQIIKASE